jgi:signal peptidase
MKDGRTSRRSRLFTGLLLVVGAGVLAVGIGFRVADFHVQTVLTGSMRPVVSPGDLAITQGVPIGSLRVGDVVVFTPPNETQTVLHRIASREGDVITTKGDANSVADPWRVTLQGATGYRLVGVVPYLGWLTELRSVALISAGLIVALLILREIRKGVGAHRAQVAS